MVAAEVCEIHWARISALRADPAALLDARERKRADAHVREEARRRFTAGAVLLRLLVGARLGVPPQAVPVNRTCPTCGAAHGKPSVPGAEVSVSHSGELVAVALSQAGAVGVDVERHRTLGYPAVARRVFTPEELGATPDPDAFFTLWTRKESALKAAGVGLRIPMSQVRVTPANAEPRLLRLGEATPPARMADAAPAPGYTGAATVLTPAPLRFTLSNADGLLAAL